MGLFDNVFDKVKKTVNDEKKKQETQTTENALTPADKVRKLGVNLEDISIMEMDNMTYICGMAENQGDFDKIKSTFSGLAASNVVVDLDVLKMYTIVDGDSPWGVAQKVWNDGNKFPILVEVNNGKDSYFTGDVIKVPSLRNYIGGHKLQVILNSLGFSVGAIDGAVGPKTIGALKDLQQKCDVQVTGKVDSSTRKTLRMAFHSGAKLEGMALQYVLKEVGQNPGAIDGVVGAKTQQAISSFQQSIGIDATGNLDDKTVKRLARKFV
jgi:hypothetical protein